MAEKSAISWTRSTFNPWRSPELFAAPQLARVANAIGLEVFQLVTGVAKRFPVINIVSQFRMGPNRLDVMRTQVSPSFVATSWVLAGVFVALKYSRSPSQVFGRPAQRKVALKFAMRKGVMLLAARRAFTGNCSNARLSFFGVLFADAIGRSSLCPLAHLAPGLGAHLGSLLHTIGV